MRKKLVPNSRRHVDGTFVSQGTCPESGGGTLDGRLPGAWTLGFDASISAID